MSYLHADKDLIMELVRMERKKERKRERETDRQTDRQREKVGDGN